MLAFVIWSGARFLMQEPHKEEQGRVLVDGRELVSVIFDVVDEVERRGRSVQDNFFNESMRSNTVGTDSILGRQNQVQQHPIPQNRANLNAARDEEVRWKHYASQLEEQLRAQKEQSRLDVSFASGAQKSKLEARVRSLEKDFGSVGLKLKASEHMVRAKDKELARMRERLQKSLDDDVRTKEREKDAFEKAFRRKAGGARDQPVLDMISGFQKQVAQITEESNHFRAQLQHMTRHYEQSCDENRMLEKKIKLAQSTSASANSNSNSPDGNINAVNHSMKSRFVSTKVPDLELLEQYKKEFHHKQEQLDLELGRIAEERKQTEEDTFQMHQTIEFLRKENNRLQEELDERPTQRELNHVKNDNKELRKALDERRCNFRQGDTRELMKKDKEMFSLGLQEMEEIGKEDLLHAVQESCRIAGASTIDGLLGKLLEMERICKKSFPQISAFCQEVSFEVFPTEPTKRVGSLVQNPSHFLKNLKFWFDFGTKKVLEEIRKMRATVRQRQAFAALQESHKNKFKFDFKSILSKDKFGFHFFVKKWGLVLLLGKRAAPQPKDADSILHAIQDLVAFERKMKVKFLIL